MTERRTGWIFILVLVAQLVLIAAQVSSPGAEPTALERGVFRLVAPVAWIVDRLSGVPTGLVRSLRSRRKVMEENRRLREQVRELKLDLLRFQGLAQEVERLSSALDYSRLRERPLELADVVYVDYTSSMRILMLRVGGSAPAQHNQPVVSAEGLLGRVIFATGPYAKVQLLTDRAAAAAAMIERTRRQGVIRGWEPSELRLELVPLQADVRPGDRVLTSGIDGVYPRGILIGTVVSVGESDDLFHLIRVRPAVDFGTLDLVYLLPLKSRSEEPGEGLPDAPS